MEMLMKVDLDSASVVLTSSDHFFQKWFKEQQHVPQHHYWVVIGISHFNEATAREYMSSILKMPLKNEEWASVFDVCGGCPALLKKFTYAIKHRGLTIEHSLEGIVSEASESITSGRNGVKDRQGWDGTKFVEICRLIEEDPLHCVGISKICRKVFHSDRRDAAAQLRAICKANLLHLRYAPVETYYSDIGPTKRKSSSERIMPVSPAQVVAMRRMDDQLDLSSNSEASDELDQVL